MFSCCLLSHFSVCLSLCGAWGLVFTLSLYVSECVLRVILSLDWFGEHSFLFSVVSQSGDAVICYLPLCLHGKAPANQPTHTHTHTQRNTLNAAPPLCSSYPGYNEQENLICTGPNTRSSLPFSLADTQMKGLCGIILVLQLCANGLHIIQQRIKFTTVTLKTHSAFCLSLSCFFLSTNVFFREKFPVPINVSL